LLDSVADKKNRLDQLRPLSLEALSRLEHYYDLEITYTSNAIEGNTLSAVETTLVIEQGVTIGGKALRDHLEAIDHGGNESFDRLLYQRLDAPWKSTCAPWASSTSPGVNSA
jgi:Fic family protein